MKKIFSGLVFLLCFKFSFAQTVSSKMYDGNNPFVAAYDIHGKPLTAPADIEGTPMLNVNWGTGQVMFANGKILKDVALQFNIFSNELCFQKDNTAYAFVETVKAFRFSYTEEEGGQKNVYFQSGYPSVNGNDTGTFYQVLTDGPNFQLLKYTSKKVRETSVYNGPVKKEYADVSEYFIYSVHDKKITGIKTDKSSLASILPEYQEKINQFAAEKKSKLKKESDIADLVAYLNQQ